MKGFFRAAVSAAMLLALAACGDDSKADILKKAQGVETRAALESELGTADDVSKLGPVEKWTYNASDGTVTFVLAGDSVTTSMTGDKAEK